MLHHISQTRRRAINPGRAASAALTSVDHVGRDFRVVDADVAQRMTVNAAQLPYGPLLTAAFKPDAAPCAQVAGDPVRCYREDHRNSRCRKKQVSLCQGQIHVKTPDQGGSGRVLKPDLGCDWHFRSDVHHIFAHFPFQPENPDKSPGKK